MVQQPQGKQGRGTRIVDAGFRSDRSRIHHPHAAFSRADHDAWAGAILGEVSRQLEGVLEYVAGGLKREAAQAQVLLRIAAWLSCIARDAQVNAEVGGDGLLNLALLTPRQRDIMALLHLHIKPRRIAELLTLSEGTVRGHIRDARKRLRGSVKSRPA